MLNWAYSRLSLRLQEQFYFHFSKIFRGNNHHAPHANGSWNVVVEGRRLKLPLRAGKYWLDWDTCLALLGHDKEVKQTYLTLLRSTRHRPSLFIDIGANYGTHSILFLSQGVETYTFEPNSSCHDYFLAACSVNALIPNLVHSAVGNGTESICLTYPPDETWLGVTSPQANPLQRQDQGWVTETITQTRLDDWIDNFVPCNTLVKIDTEGHEIAVLQGMTKFIDVWKPLIIFESHRGKGREELYGLLWRNGHEIHGLPWDPDTASCPMTADAFSISRSTNFIAIPRTGKAAPTNSAEYMKQIN